MVQRGRERDVGKERFWRDVVGRWQRSGQSIRTFCQEHRLVESSFHAWRRIIGQRDQHEKRPVVDRDPICQPTFVPVHVIPAYAAVERSALEVVLGSGRVIRVVPGFDVATLKHLLAALEETPSC
jgi:hypothetical protein